MRPKAIMAGGLFVLLAGVGSAQAAPAGGMLKPLSGATEVGIVKVHGVHRSCELGPRGWHRSLPSGRRVECRPARPKGWFWIWRSEGGRHGWYHRKEKRWH